MQKIIVLFFLMFSITYSFAQKQGIELIDSLKLRLKGSIEDTGKVRLLGKLSFQYFRFDTDSGIHYAQNAIIIAEKLHWDLGLAFSYNYLATNYAVKGNYPKALEYFHKSLTKYTVIGNKQGIAFLSNNLGNFYRMQKNYPKAIDYILKSVVINKELNNKLDLTKNYNNLGAIYSSIPDFSKSAEYYFKALKIAREINDQELVALLLVNIAEIRIKMKDYCGALELSIEALKISEKQNITYDRAVYNGTIGEIYLLLSNDSIIPANICSYYTNDKHKNLLYAEKYLKNSIDLLDKINDLATLSENALRLSQVYEKLNDNENALKYYKVYSSSKDSIFSQDNSIKLANIEKQQEVELRDKQIVIQTLKIEKKNAQIVSQIVIFILILLLISIISFYYYKKRKRQKAIAADIERTRAENQIRKLNETLEKRVAERTHELEIVNKKLEFHSNEIEQFTYITSHDLQEPLRTLTNYTNLFLEDYAGKLDEDGNKYIEFIHGSATRMSMLVKGLVEYSILGKESEISSVDCNTIVIEVISDMSTTINESKTSVKIQELPVITGHATELRLLFQNLISNAIKFRNMKVVPEVKISVVNLKNEWVFSIEDNGIGIEEKAREKIFIMFQRIHTRSEYEGTGIGLAHCKKIVKMHGGKIWVESTPGAGSTFLFTIPK